MQRVSCVSVNMQITLQMQGGSFPLVDNTKQAAERVLLLETFTANQQVESLNQGSSSDNPPEKGCRVGGLSPEGEGHKLTPRGKWAFCTCRAHKGPATMQDSFASLSYWTLKYQIPKDMIALRACAKGNTEVKEKPAVNYVQRLRKGIEQTYPPTDCLNRGCCTMKRLVKAHLW